jgi:enterobacteria phage integrase
MRWDDIRDGYLHVEQQKTGVKLAIPLCIAVDSPGISLDGVLQSIERVPGTETIIYSTRREPLSSGTVSRYFMRARKASGISFDGEPPTFHELRSLSDRLYKAQTGKRFAKNLLGHKSESMAAQ